MTSQPALLQIPTRIFLTLLVALSACAILACDEGQAQASADVMEKPKANEQSKAQPTETEKEVDRLLDQLNEQEKVLEAYRELYDIGPEADEALLDKLKGSNIIESDLAVCVAMILNSRGQDNAVFATLKAQLQDDDPETRTAAAVLMTFVYNYQAIRDLADIVSGRKSAENLDEKTIYESTFTTDEIVEQILDTLDSDSQEARDFVLAYLKVHEFDCPECGNKEKKWQAYFDDEATEDSEESPRDILRWTSSDPFTDMHAELDVDIPKQIRGLTASPDGNKIAFVSAVKSDGKYDASLWVMDTTTNKVTKIQIPGPCYYPSWAPIGNAILFQNITSRGFNVCTIRGDGAEFNVWTKSLNAMNQNAQWSPDGLKIGFVKHAYICGVREIWVIEPSRNTSSRVVKGSSCDLLRNRIYTTWFLSKEDNVVYWDCDCEDEETVGIYTISFDKPAEAPSFTPFDLDSNHDWIFPSPKEDKLSYGGFDGSLSVHDFSSQEAEEFDLGELDSSVWWSPDGRNILYSLRNDEKTKILSLETGESTVLAEGYLKGKAFGPGGDSTYYQKWDEEAERPSIWRINLDGANDTKIFPLEGIEYTTVHPTPTLKWAERN